MTFQSITENNLLLVSAETERELVDFVKSTTKPRSARRLAFKLLKDMGKPQNMLQDLIMMQTLHQLWQDERVNNAT